MSEINLSPLLISKNIKPNCTYSIYIETPKLKLLCYLNGPYYSTNTNITDGKMSINIKIKIPSYIDSPLLKRDIQITETKITTGEDGYILYQKSGNTDITEFIDKNFIDEVFPKQFIAYCVPFSKIASKHFKENKIGKYFENLGKKNHDIKNKFMNTAFINGDLFYEKDYYRNKMVLMPKPLLKCVYLEELKG